MNRANYLGTGQSYGKYPLSIESFDFIQEQINLLQPICELYDMNYILRESVNDKNGIIVIKGEVMPLWSGSIKTHISVITKEIPIIADGKEYENARTERYAIYSDNEVATDPTENYLSSNFKVAPSIKQTRQVPGQIIDLIVNANQGETTIAQVINRLFNSNGQGKNLISYKTPVGNADNVDLSNLWVCDGRQGCPDLKGLMTMMKTDKLIGSTGGSENVTLNANQIPSHGHTFVEDPYVDISHNHSVNSVDIPSTGDHTHRMRARYFRYDTSGLSPSRGYGAAHNQDNNQWVYTNDENSSYLGLHTHRVPAHNTNWFASAIYLQNKTMAGPTGVNNVVQQQVNILNPVVYVIKCMVGNKGF